MPDPTPPIKRLEQRDQSGIHKGHESQVAVVDTVRLKKDMEKDGDAINYLNNTDGGNPKSKYVADQPMYRGADALLDRLTARRDTLNDARKGKIPATDGKKKGGK